MVNDQEKQEIEKQKQKEFLEPFLDNFCTTIRKRMVGIPADCEIDKYIQGLTVGNAIEITGTCLRNISTEASEDNCVITEDFLEQVFYLYCAVGLEYKKQELQEISTTYATELEALEEEEEEKK